MNTTDFFDTQTYQPRLEQYKAPYGAVSSGTVVTFTLRPRRAWGVAAATLVARYEFDRDRLAEHPLHWAGLEGDRDLYTCQLDTADYVGLLWYSFRLTCADGTGQTCKEYQLTVYDGSDRVPTWFGEGVCYQIFPDRFHRTHIPDPTGLVGNRTVHRSWEEDPIPGAIAHTPQGKDICNRDFFGGNLPGVIEKLDYLQSLGVETLYFCPIFEAAENHRYGTADYGRIDPMLGTEADFTALCNAAHARGMRILLDGVFNHTGYISRYFNGDGFYPTLGAGQSTASPWYPWFRFKQWPHDYDCWWGIYSLPAVEEDNADYRGFIFGREDSVVRRWLRAGADGWRLDVADELPDDFVRGIHQAARETSPQAVVIGEVWEDGTTKIAYKVRRRHLLGHHLDGLMNYPFRNAAIAYLLGGDAALFMEELATLQENYPPFAFYSAMNALGTHDTLRILTCLGTGDQDEARTGKDRRLTPEERRLGAARLRLGALLLFTFPGSPTIYYGDEVGMDGYHDPFNRRPFPWNAMDEDLLAHFRILGNLRKTLPQLRRGPLRWGPCRGSLLCYFREDPSPLCILTNAGSTPHALTLPWAAPGAVDLLTGRTFSAEGGKLTLTLNPLEGLLLKEG